MSAGELTARAIAVGKDEGTALWTMGQLMLVKASAAQTGGELGALETVVSAAAAPPLHVHHREAEINYVLEGSLTMRCGDDVFEAGPGTFVYLPKGVPHAFRAGADGARMLAIVLPGGIERLYEQVGMPATELRVPHLPPDVAGWLAHAPSYGLEVVGPPLLPPGA